MTNATTGAPVPWPSRLDHNFTQHDLILGAFNSLYKLDPRTWNMWMQIMQRYAGFLVLFAPGFDFFFLFLLPAALPCLTRNAGCPKLAFGCFSLTTWRHTRCDDWQRKQGLVLCC